VKPTTISPVELARKLGLFDVTMLVMGSVIGAGIFKTPREVAELVHTPALVLWAWIAGGFITMAGCLVYAELTSRRPQVGGQYAFLREAYHPAVAFIYGWSLLWVVQSGGMAFVAVVFGQYFISLMHLVGTGIGGSALGEALPKMTDTSAAIAAAVAITVLTAINCTGVRAGSTAQNIFMVLKIAAILALVACGLLVASSAAVPLDESALADARFVPTAFAAALVPVIFSYGGSHTATFMAGEVREPERTLPRGLVLGVLGVIALYLAVNVACLRVLGVDELSKSPNPATAVMLRAFGQPGAVFISAAIAISALGFLSQATLTSPRVYYAMAQDRLFFQSIAQVNPRTQAPTLAILLQGAFAIVIAVTGTFEQIINYVMSVEMTFFCLTALSLFVLRRKDKGAAGSFMALGHPATTLLYAGANIVLVGCLFYQSPLNSAIGLGIALAGLPVYFFWRWQQRS
jgi:basic amino acid/polyamine antiporter, APA family